MKIKCDVYIEDENTRKNLIAKILDSEFLKEKTHLSWFFKKDEFGNILLDKALAGYYKSFAKKPKTDYPQHEYTKEQLDNCFDDIDTI